MRSNLAFGGSVASIAPLRRLVRESKIQAPDIIEAVILPLLLSEDEPYAL